MTTLPNQPEQSISEQSARFAIDVAIEYGRRGINKPPADHWLMLYWEIGQQLAAASSVREEAINACADAAHDAIHVAIVEIAECNRVKEIVVDAILSLKYHPAAPEQTAAQPSSQPADAKQPQVGTIGHVSDGAGTLIGSLSGPIASALSSSQPPAGGTVTDAEILERINRLDFSQMVTADDLYLMIAREFLQSAERGNDAEDARRFRYALEHGWPKYAKPIHPKEEPGFWYYGPNSFDCEEYASPTTAIDAAMSGKRSQE